MHGKGLYKWPNGNEYEGEYVKNIKEGEGEIRWKNGKKFRGKFSKGVPHGRGILTRNGVEYEAYYENGKYVGKVNDSFSQSQLDYESEY